MAAIIGHFAREHGALVPDRLITSAKSWLSNAHIDPRQRSLPWGSEIQEDKLSPFECSRRYLAHLKNAFLYAGRVQGRNRDLSETEMVLTVPASFDAVARNLTAEAAEAAGLGKVTLLEEPQAAFYAWIAQADREWRSLIGPGDIVLVCDVGGGTTDFSLIAVTDNNGTLELDRISVGEHILLGGDNMDLALAYTLQAQLEAEGKSIDSWQFLALVHAASKSQRSNLFDDDALPEVADCGSLTGLEPAGQNRLDEHSIERPSTRWFSTDFSQRPRSTTCRRSHAGSGSRNSAFPLPPIR